MSETALNGPGQVALAALSEFNAWTKLVANGSALDPSGIEVSAIDWHRDRQWSVVRYRFSPETLPEKLMVSAISRMVSVRSRRRDPTTGELKPLPNNWRQSMRTSFAPMFDKAGSLEVGDGWFDLLAAMADRLSSFAPGLQPKFDDIKSKYAELRAYHNAENAIAEAIVEAYERLSPHVCETCGAPGKTRGRGWLVTACDAHAPVEKTE